MIDNLGSQDVQNIVKKYNTKQGGTSGGFTVPRHQHNGSDALKIQMGDLSLDTRGLIFPAAIGKYTFNVVNNPDGTSQFYLSPPVNALNVPYGNLSFNGLNGEVFKEITLSSSQVVNLSVGDMTNSTNFEFLPSVTRVISTGLPWRLSLPINPSLPASPQAGDICFYNGDFYGCKVTGTWQVFTLV